MNAQTSIQKLLYEKYEEIRLKNPAYSMRAFSKRLNISPSTLSRVFSGERSISRPFAERLCTQLMLDPQERSEVLGTFPQRKKYRSQSDSVDSSYLQLNVDQYRLIGEWYHYGILSLIKTSDFKSDVAWIARRLGITEKEANQALERLERLEMIRKNGAGHWVRTRPKVRTTDDTPNVSLQKAHQENLNLASEALSRLPVTYRDFASITMPANPELLPQAKELIRKFQDDLFALFDSKPGTEVYRFCTQLFPLTEIQNKEKSS